VGSRLSAGTRTIGGTTTLAGSKSDAWEVALLDWQFGGSVITLPAALYLGLWTATLSDASTGATAGEVSAGGYARKAVTRNNTNWNGAAAGAIDNKAAIDFGTASADWGTVTHMAVLSADTSGTILYWADLTNSKIIQNGDPVVINAGALDITEA
jgi:hypothetical protein